ncbi:hypothetical protein IWZ00DRAFT_271740 [Phyllosticta capitalensis]
MLSVLSSSPPTARLHKLSPSPSTLPLDALCSRCTIHRPYRHPIILTVLGKPPAPHQSLVRLPLPPWASRPQGPVIRPSPYRDASAQKTPPSTTTTTTTTTPSAEDPASSILFFSLARLRRRPIAVIAACLCSSPFPKLFTSATPTPPPEKHKGISVDKPFFFQAAPPSSSPIFAPTKRHYLCRHPPERSHSASSRSYGSGYVHRGHKAMYH